jgi:hypothetical protein
VAATFVIYTTCGAPQREWCDRCNTSAGLTFPIFGLAEANGEPTVSKLGTFNTCTRCDADRFDGEAP